MKALLLRPTDATGNRYAPEIMEFDKPKRAKAAVKPMPIEKLVNLKLFKNA